MTKFTTASLAALMLLHSALTVARDQPTRACAKSSSFVPHPRAKHPVYGAPIKPALVGRSKASHRKYTPKKPPSRIAKRDAR
jgi:hypothetical protein